MPLHLYLVDCPESEDSLPERVAEQAAHFGTSPARMIEIGRYAKTATAQMLSRPFTVTTRFQKAMGRSKLPRYYAFIRTADNEDLGEELIRNGLARSHGSPVRAPDGRDMRAIYDNLEARASKASLGAWGGSGPIRRESTGPISESERPMRETRPVGSVADIDVLSVVANSLNTSGHRPSVRSESPAESNESTAVAGKISLNHATKAELMELSGIGEALAARIIEARPFSSVSDLKRVKGVGESRYSAVAEMVAP